MEAAERRLPQARRQALGREYRAAGVTLARRGRRGRVQAARQIAGDDSGAAEEPASFDELPMEVTVAVMRYLDPLTLATAACVSRAWRQAASDDWLWQPLLQQALGTPRSSSGSTAGDGSGCGGAASVEAAGSRIRFAQLAAASPGALLLRWKTNRIELSGGGLCWLDRGRPPPAGSYRHVSVQHVVRRLARPGAWLTGNMSTSDVAGGSSSTDEDEAGEAASLGRRMRFWQLP